MKPYIRINQRTYNELAEEYKQKRKEFIGINKKIALPFVNFLKKTFKTISVLELGPGAGTELAYFADEGFNTTALDISKNMIVVASEVSPKSKFIHGDFLEHSFKGKKFEGIYAKVFIHLFSKKDAILVLRKIYSLLKPKGVAFIGDSIHKKSEEGFAKKADYRKPLKRFRKNWTEQELVEEVSKQKFIILKKSYGFDKKRNKKWLRLYLQKT